jgi:hypothetical protein
VKEVVSYIWSTLQTGEASGGASSTGERKDPLQGGTVSWQSVKI